MAYGDKSQKPLTREERETIYRLTSDPLSFHEDFIHWLNVKYIDKFPHPPHGAQIELTEDWTNPGASLAVVEWGVTNHDTNNYIQGNTFEVPGIPGVRLSGVYSLSVTGQFDATDHGTTPYVGIFVNDVAIAIGTAVADTLWTFDVAVTRRLNENDVVDVRAFNSGGTQTILKTDPDVKAAFNIALLYKLDNGESSDAPPACTPPSIVDLPVAESVFVPMAPDNVTTTDGTWSGDAVIVITYQWEKTTDLFGVTGWADDVGETTNTVVGVDSDTWYRCRVTATNDCGTSSVVSNSVFFGTQ